LRPAILFGQDTPPGLTEQRFAAAGLLTRGSKLEAAFPGRSQWHEGLPLAAHSCGGSCGFGVSRHRIPFQSPSPGNRRVP
jgi:hypothetical protein